MFAFSGALLTRVYKGNAIPERSAEDNCLCVMSEMSLLYAATATVSDLVGGEWKM